MGVSRAKAALDDEGNRGGSPPGKVHFSRAQGATKKGEKETNRVWFKSLVRGETSQNSRAKMGSFRREQDPQRNTRE